MQCYWIYRSFYLVVLLLAGSSRFWNINDSTPFGLTFDFVYHGGNTLSKLHRDSPPLAKALRWNLSKFVVIKHFRWESLNVQPSCCLDVVVCMLNCVFWRHIPLEIEFKSRVDMGSDSNRYTAQRYHPWAVARLSTRKKTQKLGEFKTPPYPTGRRSNKDSLINKVLYIKYI